MSDPGDLSNEGLLLVRDIMEPAVNLEGNMKVRDARRTLERQNMLYGVVRTGEGLPFRIITQQELSAADEDVLVRTVIRDILYPQTVEPNTTLQQIVQAWAEDLAKSPLFKGIAVLERGRVLGILPRESIEAYTQGRSTDALRGTAEEGSFGLSGERGYSAGVGSWLAGNNLTQASGKVLFVCRDCPDGQECPNGPYEEERDLETYNPNNPPKCKWHQHTMYIKW